MQHDIVEHFEIMVEAEDIVEIEASDLDLREDMTFCNFGPINTSPSW